MVFFKLPVSQLKGRAIFATESKQTNRSPPHARFPFLFAFLSAVQIAEIAPVDSALVTSVDSSPPRGRHSSAPSIYQGWDCIPYLWFRMYQVTIQDHREQRGAGRHDERWPLHKWPHHRGQVLLQPWELMLFWTVRYACHQGQHWQRHRRMHSCVEG